MTTALQQLREMYAYMKWADLRVLDAAATVSDDGLRREQNISAGSIHKLLLHVMGAQWIWHGRWQGESTRKFPTVEDLPMLDNIRHRWADIHRMVLEFVDEQTDESIEQTVNYVRNGQPHSNKLLHIMCHLVDHSTYHRGQLNSMIKLAGGKAADVGYITYTRIQSGQQT